jgi:hypothetical protein
MIGTRLIDRHEITHELGTGGNEIIVQLLEKNPNERRQAPQRSVTC